VPPLALLVSGGKLSQESIPRIERYIEEHLKGKKNFHKILILEAEGSNATSEAKAKIELKPLTDAQQQDALFQDYDERNIDKVGSSFRVPRLLRGESRDFNRSVADAQLRFAEDQVFQPERDAFDFVMNHKLLADMGIRFWRFLSQTPSTRDPERMTVMVEKLVRVGVLTPEEGRMLSEDIFNREFRKIKEPWVRQPITLTLAGIQNSGSTESSLPSMNGSLFQDAQKLIQLRKVLEQEEMKQAEEHINEMRVLIHKEEIQ
jgi:capsid portal protein